MLTEAADCKHRIEAEIQKAVEHFAYPSGRDHDVGDEAKRQIRNAGYTAAVTTAWGLNGESSDVMALRRGGPWERHPGVFGCKLDWYQLVNE